MEGLGWDITNLINNIEIKRKTLETEITLSFVNNEILIKGTGDLSHHLIEDTMLVINKLAELKGISHQIT